MQFLSLTLMTATFAASILAYPQPDAAQSDALVARHGHPSFEANSFNCGTKGPSGLNGLPNEGAPSMADTITAAKALDNVKYDHGECVTPKEKGQCSRIACVGQTGLFMCNTDGYAGPHDIDCKKISPLIYDEKHPEKGFTGQCVNGNGKDAMLVSGQVLTNQKAINIIAAKANCGEGASVAPEHQTFSPTTTSAAPGATS